MSTNEWSPDTVFEVLSDRRARQILLATGESPCSAKALLTRVDGSHSSIYRRIDVLGNYGFLTEETRIDPDGHHYHVYTTECDRIDISLCDDRIEIDINGATYEEDPFSKQGTDDEE
jgi:DNA-binding transcriptional ArsR family regulator